ncbi:MAG: ABC transporter permease [Solirubrobacterales bacterium]
MSTVAEPIAVASESTLPSRRSSAWQAIRMPIASILIAIVASGLLLLVAGYDPLTALRYFLLENFTSGKAFEQVLVTATPLLILAISVIVAFRAGIVNIGQEGQMYVGACAGAVIALQLTSLPGPAIIIVAIAAAMIAAAVWAGVMGALRAYLGVNEIVTSLMLDYVAVLLTQYAVQTWFKAPGFSIATETLPEKVWWPVLPGMESLTWAVAPAILLCAGAWVLLFRTRVGLRMRASGVSPRFAEAIGTSPRRVMLVAALASGMIAGIAGINIVLGAQHQFLQGFSPGYGWAGLAVALLARLNPIGAVVMALLYAAMLNGSGSLQIFTEVPAEFVNIVIGLVVLLVTAQWSRAGSRRTAD